MNINRLRRTIVLLVLGAALGASQAETLVVLGDHAYAPSSTRRTESPRVCCLPFWNVLLH